MGRSPGVYETSERRSKTPIPMNEIPTTSFGHRESLAPLRFDLFLDLGINFYPELQGELCHPHRIPQDTRENKVEY
jgi:hypothetical protein